MGRRHGRGIVVGLVLLLGTCLTFARQRTAAPEPPPAAKSPATRQPNGAAGDAGEPQRVLSASVASIDELAAFAKDAGLGDVPFLSATFIEQQLPFIGNGGLAPDRPLGALLYAAGELDLDRLVYVLPVQPGKASLKQFADTGARPLKGRTDTVTLEGVGYRRGKDQFIFGAMPAAVAAVREDALAPAYAGNDRLAHVELDLAAIRGAAPAQYGQFFAAMGVEPPSPEAGKEGELVARPLNALNRLALSLARGDGDGLRLSLLAEPVAFPQAPPGKLARPGFPRGTIFRADLAYAPGKALGPVFEAIDLFDRDRAAKETKEQHDLRRAVDADVRALVLGGEGASLGVEMIDGQPVVYWITRHAGDAPDPGRLMQSIVTRQAALSKLDRQGRLQPLTLETYTAGAGSEVHRLSGAVRPGATWCIDAARGDGAVLMTFSATDGKHIERLLPLPPEGHTAAPLSGWLDLAALAAAGGLPDGDEIGIGRTAMKELTVAVKGQRIAWSVSPSEGAVRLDVDVPTSVLRALAKAAGLAE